MVMAFDNLDSEGGMKKLNGFLTTRSYIEGYTFTDADVSVFKSIPSTPNPKTTPYAYRWYIHIAALLGLTVVLSKEAPKVEAPAKKAAAPAPAAAAKPAAKDDDEDDDDDDLFGDDDEEEDPAAAEAAKKAAAARAEAAKAKAKKAKPVERSQCVLEVKPWESDQDLESLAAKIKAVQIEGLKWGEGHKLVPVAFGIKKLVVSCIIVDDMVGVDDITEAIEAFEDEVQSVDMVSMNKV